MADISKKTERSILEHVARDLKPSLIRIHAAFAFATLVGGLLSLAVCGQFGIGWTNWADAFSTTIHESMSPWTCAFVCGSLFAVFPTAVLKLSTTALFFRCLIHNYFAAYATWLGGFGMIVATAGHHGNGLVQVAVWIFSAWGAGFVLSKIFSGLLPSFSLRSLLN